MPNTRAVGGWVVYQSAVRGAPGGTAHHVCEQQEWNTLVAARPGVHTLIRAGIPTEGEAERLARVGACGVPGPSTTRGRRPVAPAPAPVAAAPLL